MKALILTQECPSCGNVLKIAIPAQTIQMLKANLKNDSRCACGRKGNFTVLGFATAELELKREEKGE